MPRYALNGIRFRNSLSSSRRILCEKYLDLLLDLVDGVQQLMIRVEDFQLDIRMLAAILLGIIRRYFRVMPAMKKQCRLREGRRVRILQAVLVKCVMQFARAAVAIVVEFEPAFLLPLVHPGLAENLREAPDKSECGSQQDHPLNLGIKAGMNGGEISAQARADQGNRFAAGEALDQGELARDGEVFEVALVQIGHFQFDANCVESVAKVTRLMGGRAGSETVQVNYPSAHRGGSGISVNLISASAPNFLKGE